MESGRTYPGRLLADKQAGLAAGKSAERRYATPDLLLVDGIANGEALATLGATAAQDGTAPAVFHAGHETMLVDALTIVRLECSFHDKTFFFAKF